MSTEREARGESSPQRPNPEDDRSTRFSPEDALALFTKNLDLTLEKHKESLFKEVDARLSARETRESTPPVKQAPKFRYEGNEKQFKFNDLRLQEVERALSFLQKGRVTAALSELESCSKAVKERNKILRIADKYGWDVVDEYVDDPLTESTDDATKLRQAEFRAKAKRREKSKSRWLPYRQDQHREPFYSAQYEFTSKPSSTSAREVSRPGRGFSNTRSATPRSGSGRVYSQAGYFSGAPQESDRCYTCNEEGHWSYQCPRRRRYPGVDEQLSGRK